MRRQRTGDASGKPFLVTASQELGLVYKVTRGSREEQFESSKPRNAPQRERLDGLERWEGDVLEKLEGLHPHQKGEANYQIEQMEVNSSSLNSVLAFGSSRSCICT